eukprot:6246061-Amphidinium_carterae.1
MQAVSKFHLCMNGFEGRLPESGIRTMSTVTNFIDVSRNSFKGALPESGLQVMRAVRHLLVNENGFAGTLPNRAVAGLETLVAFKNDFEGK